MQTIYYSTTNFVRHTGTVVDLETYRQKLALAQAGSLAPQLEEPAEQPELWTEETPVPARERNSARRARRAMRLDCLASLCVVVMTLVFTLRILTF